MLSDLCASVMALTLARRVTARVANLRDPLADEREQEQRSAETEQGGEASAVDRECMPCSGSGKVISKLGGEDHAVDCPWCEGSGQRVAGIDAQAHWPMQREEPGADPAAAQTDGAG